MQELSIEEMTKLRGGFFNGNFSHDGVHINGSVSTGSSDQGNSSISDSFNGGGNVLL